MKVIALVPSAGSGRRMSGQRDDKPFLRLKDKPLLYYVLSSLERTRIVDSIILVAKGKYLEEAGSIVKEYGISKVSEIIPGGETRSASVKNGLNKIKASDEDIVLIHDGVRPFLTEDAIRQTVEAAKEHGASVLGIPCTSTIKKVSECGFIEETTNRNILWEAQTPQAFRYGVIKEAYEKCEGQSATDDSCFVERLGIKVQMVPGDKNNIKVTVPEDLILAEAILGARVKGQGSRI